MAFSTQDVIVPIPTRQDFANAFGNNQRLIRFFEQLTDAVRKTLPDAIVSVNTVSTAPFVVQSASSLVPNAYVLTQGHGLTFTTAPGSLTVALTVPIPVADGGTGGTTAATARANLSAAQSGANSDITSLSGLTTPLSIAQGGTGANNAATALSNLGGVTAAQAAAAAPVQSVFGRIGTVTVQTGDYSVGQVTGAAALAGAAFTGAVSVAGAFTQTGGGAVTFSVRPTWAGATPYDTGNLNPALYALLSGAAFTGAVSVAGAAFTPAQTFGIVGTTTNNNANAGSVGEYATATGTAVSVTSATLLNVTSVPLSAGDWEVSGSIAFTPAAGTTPTVLIAGANTASATLPTAPFNTVQQLAFPVGLGQAFAIPPQRVSLAAAGTLYLVAEAVFSGGTLTATGTIRARRPR